MYIRRLKVFVALSAIIGWSAFGYVPIRLRSLESYLPYGVIEGLLLLQILSFFVAIIGGFVGLAITLHAFVRILSRQLKNFGQLQARLTWAAPLAVLGGLVYARWLWWEVERGMSTVWNTTPLLISIVIMLVLVVSTAHHALFNDKE